MDHVVTSGLMNQNELKQYEALSTPTVRWFLPVTWVQRIIEKELADDTNVLASPPMVAHFLRELNHYRHHFR